MHRRRAIAFAAAALGGLASCSSSEPDAPALGTGDGPVVIAPLASLEPGTVVPVRITSSLGDGSIGGTCTLLERWDDGDWEVLWNLGDAPKEPAPVEDDLVTCNALGVTFPYEVDLALPPDLDAGTWRLAYGWVVPGDEASGTSADRNLATYVFEVTS